jgi:hypothetical protein
VTKRDCIMEDIYTDFQASNPGHILIAYPAEIPKAIKQEVSLITPKPYLFGSRYMAQYWPWGGKADNSDWDFAFPYNGYEHAEVSKLESLGWEPKDVLKYMDNISFAVYEKIINGHKVQMCSKINLGVFKRTWERIQPKFYWHYLHKSSSTVLPKEVQKDIFNQMYTMSGW